MQMLSSKYVRLLPIQLACNGRLQPRQRRSFNREIYPQRKKTGATPSLPALDKKWRSIWQEKALQKSEVEAPSWFGTWGRSEKEKSGRKKMYILPMFPYPSGTLHLGHLRVYTISDVLSRFQRMQGYEVMHPIGWDAFGLPAENAARDRGLPPGEWTKHNIQQMWSQLEQMNGQWDLQREFSTCDPDYYKHTQRLFLLLHERGLAYQAEALVNYDPVDKTVLANEQVDAQGYSWRSGAKVEKKMLKQWFFKISEFRQQLLDDLDYLAKDGAWPERVLAMQRNWLGKSTGAQIKFAVIAEDGQEVPDIQVFTTRPDTIFGVQYLALASSHPLVQSFAKMDPDLQVTLDKLPSLVQDTRLGYLLPNVRALNPLASDVGTPQSTRDSIPIYFAPYVLGNYGDGAVMGVPGHDARDHAFWKENNPTSPIRAVIESKNKLSTKQTLPMVGEGLLNSQNGPFAGLSSQQAAKKIIHHLGAKDLGSNAETWRLRDWLVSRQRYWGTPIPIVHCKSCGPVPVPEHQLPVKLPTGSIDWTKSNGNELFNDPAWLHTPCPKCGSDAKRETDTMDTFVDSSWYFMRFPDSENTKQPFSPESANDNLPVDLYIGGVEHAILHLLYARFISKFIATTPLWPAGSSPEVLGEPFKKVLTQGMVHGKTYSDPISGRFLKPDEVDLTYPTNPTVKASKAKAIVTFEKMSKSKYNGVDPTQCISKYGADVTRAHMLFQAPVSDVLEWDDQKIKGVSRWLNNLNDFIQNLHVPSPEHDPLGLTPLHYFVTLAKNIDDPLFEIKYKDGQFYHLRPGRSHDWQTGAQCPSDAEDVSEEEREMLKVELERDKVYWRGVQDIIKSVTDAYSKTYSLNTVVSDLMILTNICIEYAHTSPHTNVPTTSHARMLKMEVMRTGGAAALCYHGLVALTKLIAPIAPALGEELWERLNSNEYAAGRKEPGDRGSVFDQPFPEVDGSYDLLAPAKRVCAIQINGKLRLTLELPQTPANLEGQAVQAWLTAEILKTKEGKEKLAGGEEGFTLKGRTEKADIRKARNVIVVRSGKTINYVV